MLGPSTDQSHPAFRYLQTRGIADLLGDFPFADQASKANALATLLLPLCRGLIDGPTPLHIIHAPTEATGKTLLADVLSIVATGRPGEPIAEACNEDEWRKRITAVLAGAPTFFFLDNLNRPLDSAALASALTAPAIKDRLLGVSKSVVLPVRCVWLATGNNVTLSREMVRRTISIRLDAKSATPGDRTDFRTRNFSCGQRRIGVD
jgi:hypothetical protein